MSAIPGSPARRVLFWMHLASGIVAGLFVLLMSVTGVLLAYEHQLTERAARANHVTAPAGTAPLAADALATIARGLAGDDRPLTLVFERAPGAPVTVTAGRNTVALLNPYTGERLTDASTGTRDFLGAIERWHRWLGGEPRSTGAHLLDAANLAFLFLIASGIWLWLPAVWRWRTVRGLLLPRLHYVNSKVRDFNWHHVFSAWALIPLFLICLSGVVISYGWANQLVYAAFGEAAPQRGGPPGAGGASGPRPGGGAPGAAADFSALEPLRRAAMEQVPGWSRISVPLPGGRGPARASVEYAGEGFRPLRTEVSLADDGASPALHPPPPQSAGQAARVWLRFVHTGEQYGFVGQTLAALASLAACVLVWTGLALAWRRLRPRPAT